MARWRWAGGAAYCSALQHRPPHDYSQPQYGAAALDTWGWTGCVLVQHSAVRCARPFFGTCYYAHLASSAARASEAVMMRERHERL